MIIKQISPNCIMETGIKRAWENIRNGLIKKGHEIIKKGACDIAFANTYDPLSFIRLLRIKKPKVIHAATTYADLKGTFIYLDMVYGLALKYLRKFYSKADRIITISNFAKKCLIEMGLKNKRIDVISCGVDTKKFSYSKVKRDSFRKEHGIKKDELLILNVGMPTWRKGIDTFIKLGAEFPNVKFLWVGKPIRFKKNWFKIKKLLKNKTDNVKFTGYVKDIVSAYCGADIFLFTTRSENEGLPILEAGACKRPIISSNLPPIKEKINNETKGLLCNNYSDFVKQVRKLTTSSSLRNKLGLSAFKMAKKYDVSTTISKIINILEQSKKS